MKVMLAKKLAFIFIALFFGTFTFHSQADALIVVDGQIHNDWGVTPGAFGATDWTPTHPGAFAAVEDQINWYLGPGGGGQAYDVEAIYFARESNMAYFAVVTGYSLDWNPGDFFIDFGSDGSYEFGIETTGNFPGSSQGELFENVLSSLGGFDECGPFALSAGNSQGVGQFGYDDTTYIGDDHYVFEMGVPVSWFGSYWPSDPLLYTPAFTAHWTMVCGNDCLDLVVPRVVIPEPATALLFLTGLGGLAFFRRKRSI